MAARNFARYDSLVIFLARSGKNSRSLSLAPFLARYRSLSLSLRGLLSPIPLSDYFELNIDGRTRGHSLKLVKHRCKTEICRHFFSERVINRWNMLDQDTVSVKTVHGFKSKLEKERSRKMGLFLD